MDSPSGDRIASLDRFCSRAQNVLEQIHAAVDLPPRRSSSSPGSMLLQCPFDPRHTMPASALLRHSLRCPASPLGLADDEDAAGAVASLRYMRRGMPLEKMPLEEQPQPLPPGVAAEEIERKEMDFGFDPSRFWYDRAPGPVAADQPLLRQPKFGLLDPPGCIKRELERCELPTTTTTIEDLDRLLPSQCWLLQQEVTNWTTLPSRYSKNALVSAMAMEIDKNSITGWLLQNSVQHGVVLDPVLAYHLSGLAALFLAAIKREALGLWKGGGSKVSSFDCPVLLESGTWLMSQLFCLYRPSAAGGLILGLLQNSLISSARHSALDKLELSSGSQQLDDDQSGNDSEKQAEATVCDVDAIVEALQERTALESFLRARAYMSTLTRERRVGEYDVLVSKAAEDRLQRPDYKPLLEHDGLGWHRSQAEDSKSKTKEELLAEERDYKRRRMSYRGKKVKRSITQVMRDIIDSNMEQIVDAGGIGTFKAQSSAKPESTRDAAIDPARDKQKNRSSGRHDQREKTTPSRDSEKHFRNRDSDKHASRYRSRNRESEGDRTDSHSSKHRRR